MSALELKTTYFEDLAVGMRETYAKTVTDADVRGFAEVSGDHNPIHLSEEFAAKTPFKSRIAHGIYTASLISAVIATRLPGPGTIYMSQTLNFMAPVRIGDTVVASVEITELSEKGRRAKLKCECKVGETLVLAGEAMVKAPGRPN
jgi:3-hydroxybutyryl-CoA dehydratase